MSDDISAVKSRLDVVSVIGSYVTGLKKSGRNYSACCPFHNERTPSFMINPDLQIFKCFGCGEAGDVISFIQKIERVDFSDALQMAAERAGYQLTGKGKNEKQAKEQSSLYEMNELAAQYWNFLLTKHNAGAAGREYCQQRKIESKEIELFKIGYAPNGNNLLQFLQKKKFTPEEILKAGLVVERNGRLTDKFRNRLMMPIFNLKGQIVGFSGRIVVKNDMAPKYLNSPETLVYKKSEILMGMYQAKEAARAAKFLIMQEGNIDLLSSHKVNVGNIVATGGTAVTLQQMQMVKRLADSVYFCFDTDSAGQKALVKAIEMAEQAGISHFVINLGEFKDPDDMISTDAKLWEAAVKAPVDSFEYLLNTISKEHDLATAQGKRAVLNEMLPIVKSIKEPVSSEHYVKMLAVKLETSVESIKQAQEGKESGRESRYQPGRMLLNEKQSAAKKEDTMDSQMDNTEKYLLALLCGRASFAEMEIEAGVINDVVGVEILAELQKGEQNFSDISDRLSSAGKALLQELLTTPLPADEVSLRLELEKTYKNLYVKMLRRKLLAYRARLQESPEGSDLLDEVQEISHQLAILEK